MLDCLILHSLVKGCFASPRLPIACRMSNRTRERWCVPRTRKRKSPEASSPWVCPFGDIFKKKILRAFTQRTPLRILFPPCAGLSYPVYKGVMKKGYNVPTPIQRKVSRLPLVTRHSFCRISRSLFTPFVSYCDRLFPSSWMGKMSSPWRGRGAGRRLRSWCPCSRG